MSRIKLDPGVAARLRSEDRKRDEILARYDKVARPLTLALRRVGISAKNGWQLREYKQEYPLAIPVLLEHLQRDYPPLVREGIAWALARKWARNLVWDRILELYVKEPNLARQAPPGELGMPAGAKDAMANVIFELARPADFDTIAELLSDPSNGPSRGLFVPLITRSRRPQAIELLVQLRDDLDLEVMIEEALRTKLRRLAKKNKTEGKLRN